jgi:CheY-like chemotaxis protein
LGKERPSDIPIIAMTSFAMSGDRDRIMAIGCNGYFEKPINPLTIVDDIHKILEGLGR